ncbi:GOLPH3/VPS74 family protein [Bailinhaonella thermotolerans]|uniref:GPP34 family phosphoprotein n=1 Tax=Bailinhaonella thermotolerans TaxID=1070861 RepID=A0A3A4A2T1_9ACTN|nr:GPP34 family phosphoprotein [Bailinhaonella thermotolerans]RJL22735.1 GPP34 family phosphoprotein [Bailinhaonella thermotolerans]
MHAPETLPERLYLLAYDPERGRLTARSQLGMVVRAAALAELRIQGLLQDRDDRPAAAHGARSDDPLLAEILRQISESRPRRWHHWVGKNATRASRLVRERLAETGWIQTERRAVLGIFPYTRVSVSDPRPVRDLTDAVRHAVTTARPTTRRDEREAATVALCVTGDLKRVLDRRARRAHKDRIAKIVAQAGPVPPALRKAIRDSQAAAASAG